MTSIQSRILGGVFATVALCAPGCDNSDGPTGSSGFFVIGVSPPAITIPQNSTGFIAISLVRSGFDGVVSLSISGLPSGVSATMDPAQISGVAVEAHVTLTASATAALGTTSVTLTGASGGKQSTVDFALTISAAPNYTLSLAPPSLTIPAGTSGAATVNIERVNFSGVVVLELLDVPSGVTWGFTPASAGLTTSSLSIAVGPSVPPGNYPLTLRGGGPGVPERVVLFQLTVTSQPGGGLGLEYSFCDPDAAPLFFAVQDGAGAWQHVTAVTAGGVVRFPFNLTSSVGGVLAVYRFGGQDGAHRSLRGAGSVARRVGRASRVSSRPRTSIFQAEVSPALSEEYFTDVAYATRAELQQEAAASCARSFPTKTVQGTVAGVAPGQYGVVSLGESGTIFDGAASTNPVVFTDVQSGLVDFFGTRIVTPGQPPDRAVMFRDLNPADGGALPQPIDFNGPASFQPAVATGAIAGGLGELLEVYTSVHTTTTNGGFWNDLAPSSNATRPWAGLPAASMRPGDFHGITVFANPPDDPDNFRATVKYVGAVSNQSISFGPVADPAAATLLTIGPYPRYRFQGTLPAEYNKAVGFNMVPETEGNAISMYVTTAYLAANGSPSSYDISMPDLTGVTSFPIASRLTAGVNSVMTDIYGFTGNGVFNVEPKLGNEFKVSFRTTSVVVP